MSFVSEKTNSSNITNEPDPEFKFNDYYQTIIRKSNKMTNTIYRKSSELNSIKSSTISSQIRKEKNIINYENKVVKVEENKNPILSGLKKNKLNMLFKNLLIREKQKPIKRNSVKINEYNLYIKKEPKKINFIVNNNSSLFKLFLSQNRSNFNNKYKAVYSISDWRQKNHVISLLDSIKRNEHRNNFQEFLKLQLAKKYSSCRIGLKKSMDNKINFDITPKKEILRNDYLKDIYNKKDLIKIKTMKAIRDNKKRIKLKKSNTDIFYNNNTLFRTMPVKKLKMIKKSSFA